MRIAGTLLLLLGLAGCDPIDPRPDGGVLPDGGEAGGPMELGTTDSAGAFTALGGDIDAIPGSQGGFHLDLLYRLPQGGQGPVTFEHRVVRARDNTLVSRGTRQWDLGLFLVAPWTSPTAVNVFMCPTPVGVDVIGEELFFTVKARDAKGRLLAEGTGRATFRCGANATAWCRDICKG